MEINNLYTGIRQRKNGTWEKRYYLRGKRYSIYGKTKDDVINAYNSVEKSVQYRIENDPKSVTFDEYFLEYVKSLRNIIKPQSIERLINMYKPLQPYFLEIMTSPFVCDTRSNHIILLRDQLSCRYSYGTMKHILSFLRNYFQAAKNDGLIDYNPAEYILAQKKNDEEKATSTIHRALTVDEQKLFFMQLADEDHKYRFLLKAMLLSGLRAGEAAALRWEDIDFDQRCIHIRHTLTVIDHITTLSSLKNSSSYRDIPLTKGIEKVLFENKERIIKQFGPKYVEPANYVFLILKAERAEPVLPGEINKCIDKVLFHIKKRYGIEIERFTSHCMRDTFATRFLESGGDLRTLKDLLGHESFRQTTDIYGQVLSATRQKEMKIINYNWIEKRNIS